MHHCSDTHALSRNTLLLEAISRRAIHPHILCVDGLLYTAEDTIRLLTTQNEAILAVSAARDEWRAAIAARDDLEKRARAVVGVLLVNLHTPRPAALVRAVFPVGFENRQGTSK